MVAPREVSPCRSKGPKNEWIARTYDHVIASGGLKGKVSQMEVVEDFESRTHKAVSFVVKREKGIQEWMEQKLPKVLPGYSGGRLPRRSAVERGREEGEEEKESRKRKVRCEIVQKVVASIKEKAGGHEDAFSTEQRSVGQRVKQNWDSSRIEKRSGGGRGGMTKRISVRSPMGGR